MLTILSVAYPFALVGIDPVGGAEQIMSLVERAIHVAGHRSGLARNGAGAQSRQRDRSRRLLARERAIQAGVRRKRRSQFAPAMDESRVGLIDLTGAGHQWRGIRVELALFAKALDGQAQPRLEWY